MHKIRNIKSIQVFGVAARFESVSRAARYLNTSQSAVSYHIKKLEDDLQVALFNRTPLGLTLTAEGARLAQFVEVGLDSVRKGLLSVADMERKNEVRVAVPTMFASRWLAGRLGGFWERFPGIHLSFRHHNNTYATNADSIRVADMGVQWGRGHWEGFSSELLLKEKMVVTCSPRYLERTTLNSAADMRGCTLLVGSRQLYLDDRAMWQEWFDHHGLVYGDDQQVMYLEDRHFQLSTALNGHGVALFIKSYIHDELESGQLVMPFGGLFETSFAYHLVHQKGDVLSPGATAFWQWLVDQPK